MQKKHVPDLKLVGRRIRDARHALCLTQEKAAEQTELTGQYWSLLETGRERGSVAAYLQIANALGLTLDDLFYDAVTNIRIQKAFSYEGLLSDCTDAEKAILKEMVFALKDILSRNRQR